MPDEKPDTLDLAARALKPKPEAHYDEVMAQLDQRFGKRESWALLGHKGRGSDE